MQTQTTSDKTKKRPGRKAKVAEVPAVVPTIKAPAKKRLKVTDAVISLTPPKPLVEYVYKRKRVPKSNPAEYIVERRVGVLYATVNESGKVCIGFSVCHNTKDRFDYIRGMIHKPGHGLKIASERAERWADREYYEPIPALFDPDFSGVVRIPTMIQIQLKDFIER